MKTLLISDLHFTTKPLDDYRWALFDKVNDLIKSEKIEEIMILGDLTDAKDNHSAILVNKIVDGIASWARQVEKIRILRGNHDGINEDWPYFEFLSRVESDSDYPKIDYYASIYTPVNEPYIFLPHTKDPEKDWKKLDFTNKVVFAHVSVDGAVYETGMSGKSPVKPEIFDKAKLAFSGDIHSPQKIGNLVYVGCPYKVRFNDTFQGGGILLDTKANEYSRITFDFPNRYTIAITSFPDLLEKLSKLDPSKDDAPDQFKIRLHLNQENFHDYQKIKQETQDHMAKLKVHLSAFEIVKEVYQPVKLDVKERQFTDFEGFCKKQVITPELVAVGKQIINEVQ